MFQFLGMVCHIDLHTLRNTCIPGINPTWSWCMCCWNLWVLFKFHQLSHKCPILYPGSHLHLVARLPEFESSSVSAWHSHPWRFCRALPSYFADSPSVGFPSGANGKESACQCRRHKGHRFDPWVGKIPWRRAWQFTPVFLPGEALGQKTLVGKDLGLQRLGHNWSDLTCMHSWVYWSLLTTKFRLHVLASIHHKSDAVSCSSTSLSGGTWFQFVLLLITCLG